MKTRIIYPKNIWYSKTFKGLTTTSKLLSVYLVSNDNVGLTRIYKQHDLELCFLFSLSENELNKAKEELSNAGLYFFKDEFVYINNDFAYVDYVGRDRLLEAKEKELNSIPAEIITYFKGVINGLITGYKPPINNKSKIINHKYKIINTKTEQEELAEFTSSLFSRTVRVSDAWVKNFKEWRKTYNMDEIKKALESWKRHGWIWPLDGQGGDLVLLFRTKNKAGDCDYIDQLINRSKSNSSRKLAPNEYIDSNGNIRIRKQNA